MQFTDSHHHLQDYKTKNAQQIIKILQEKGFAGIVCVSSKPDEWKTVAEIAVKNPQTVIPAFGIHPWYIKGIEQNWPKKLEEFLKVTPKSQIGECGLDRLKAPVWEGQLEVFEVQAELARQFRRPLNIHILKAENDFHCFWEKMPQRFMFHSFSGSFGFLRKALDKGAYISISAAILKRKNATEIIRMIPLDHLLTETDAPYQTNTEDMINLISKISEEKKISVEKIIQNVFQNFQNFNKEEIC